MINSILSLGTIFILGLVVAKAVNKLKLPSVTGYILLGIIIGPYVLNIVSKEVLNSAGFVSNIVLSLVAFSLGQNFVLENFRKIGKEILCLSVGEVMGAVTFVTIVTWLLTKLPFHIALVLGAISTATAPAATVMIVREYRSRGKFTDTLLGIVAIDDAWGLILFAVCFAVAKSIEKFHGLDTTLLISSVIHAFFEIFGSMFLGLFCGYLLSFFSGFTKTSAEFLIYTLGIIFLNTGISILFGFSVLLSNMFLGTVVANIDKTSFRFFDTIKTIDSPLYLLFFVLAGASLEITSVRNLGILATIYVVSRLIGKMLGAYLTGVIISAEEKLKKYLGLGLAPQAGVALGLALIAKEQFPQIGTFILSTIIVTTVIYELIGPILTKIALEKAGEINVRSES